MARPLLLCLFIHLISYNCCFAQPEQQQEKNMARLIAQEEQAASDTSGIRQCLDAGKLYVDKPGNNTADMDAALRFARRGLSIAQKLHDENGLVRSYTLLSQISREKGDEKQAKQYVSKAVAPVDKSLNPGIMAQAYFEASNYYNLSSDSSLRQKIDYYAKGLKYFEASNPGAIKLADALKFMGDLTQYRGNYREAVPYLKRSLALYQKAGYNRLQDIYSLLGNVMIELRNMHEGVRYNLLAIKALEADKDSSMTACQAYFNLSMVYSALDDYKAGMPYILKSYKIAQRNKDSTAIVVTGIQVGASYMLLHQPQKALRLYNEIEKLPTTKSHQIELHLLAEKIYDDLEEYGKAGYYCDLLLREIAGRDMENNIVQNAHLTMLRHLLLTRQYAEVKSRSEKLINYASNRPAWQLSLQNSAFQADSALGNANSAMLHLKKATDLKIAELKKTYDDQVGRLQIEFELTKKDQDIAFKAKSINLLTHKNQLQNVALRNQKLIRNLIIAAAVLLVLLLIMGYNRYKIKQQANTELEERQEEINTQNESLRELVNEREWLLKEIHHRVKNNLQIVISLLNSQMFNIKDAAAKEVMKESQLRMHSISLIHQRLYQNKNMAEINMHDYIRDLTAHLQDSFGTAGKISFRLAIEDVNLDVSQAVPLGLILNEAVTNSIKYAFDERIAQPAINIGLKKLEGDMLEVVIADNGNGWAPEFNPSMGGTLGMNLITGLTRQLRGEISFTCSCGVCIKVLIPFKRTVLTAPTHEQFLFA